MKRILALYISLFFSATAVLAQGTLRGRVEDAGTRQPLAGASVVNAAGTGTVTDANGNFSLACQNGTSVSISFVGYETLRQSIKNCDQFLVIALDPLPGYLQNIEITASSIQNKSLLYQPASLTRLQERELKRGNGLFLDDAINGNVPGVTMQRRTVSGGQQFNIRGYGNGTRGTNGISSNFDGQGYKVYLNGIPLTDAEGITQMDDIDFASIGDVDVLKGPAGTLYGLAIAGAVNLHLREPEKGKTSIGQELMLGSYGLRRYNTHFEMGGDHGSLLLNYGYQHADGFMTHTASTKKFFNAAGQFQVNDKESLFFYAAHSNSYDERGGELTLDQYASFDYSGNSAYIKRNAHSEIISFRGGIDHTYQFSSRFSNTSILFGSGASTNSSSAAGWTDKDPVNYGFRTIFSGKFPLTENISLSGVAGAELQTQRAQVIGYTMVQNPNDTAGYYIVGAMRSNQYYKTYTSTVFTDWTLLLPADLSFTAGVSLSTMNIDLNNRMYSSGSTLPTRYTQSYNGMWSPRLAVNKLLNKHVSVYLSYSKGYKAPTSSYFFIPATGALNSGLKPEIGNQVELGTKGSLLKNRLYYELALFNAVFSDKMTAIAVPLNNTTTAYTYVANGGKQKDKGIELLLKYTAYQSADGFFRSIRPFGNLTYSDFKYDGFQFQKLNNPPTSTTVIDYSGKAVAGVPRLVVNLGVDFNTHPGLYGNINYQYKDGFPISSDGAYNSSSYNLLNAKIGWQRSLGRHLDLNAYMGVYNITGTQYAYMVFVNQLPDAYLPAPYDANYFGGLDLKYNF